MRPEEWLLIEWPEGEAEPMKYFLSTGPSDAAQGRLEWNLTSSTIMVSAVTHQILREPMFDVEPMH
jgi:hypothetical protein